MASSLSRLFAYARSDTTDPRENFTTEALAAAARSDPKPLLEALARLGALDPDEVHACIPFTQVHFEHAGTVDLMLQIETVRGASEIWIEVKVDAPESGQQLGNYRVFIDAGDIPRSLVVLSKERLPSAVPHIHMRWRDVTRAARAVAPDHLLWTELSAYLEEIHMVDRSTFPITLREAASLDDAFGVFTKAIAVIRAVNRRLGEHGYPGWLVSSQTGQTGWLTSKVHDQFVRWGRVMIDGRREFRANVFYGFLPLEGEVMASVWVEADPRRTAERQALRSLSKAKLDSSWEQPLDHRWQLAIKSERGIAFETESEAVAWFLARFVELRDAGIIALIPKLGSGPPVGPDETAGVEV